MQGGSEQTIIGTVNQNRLFPVLRLDENGLPLLYGVKQPMRV
jgi:hypothetical protein